MGSKRSSHDYTMRSVKMFSSTVLQLIQKVRACGCFWHNFSQEQDRDLRFSAFDSQGGAASFLQQHLFWVTISKSGFFKNLWKIRLDFLKLAWKPINFFTYLESPLKTESTHVCFEPFRDTFFSSKTSAPGWGQ